MIIKAIRKLYKILKEVIDMLKLNESLFELKNIENKLVEIDSKINDTKIILSNLEKDYKSTSTLFENLQGNIAKQRLEAESIISVLNDDFKSLNIVFAYDFDMNSVEVKENENLVDCFEFNEDSNEFEQNVLISKSKFSSKKIHIEYCNGISFIYEQLDKLVK